MKLGIITDIHSNTAALQAVLDCFRKENIDGILCAGDLIAIGPQPEETVQLLRAQPDLLSCVRGNHEHYLFGGLPTQFPNEEGMEPSEVKHHRWVHSLLSASSVEFLRALPYADTKTLCGKRIYTAHYSMNAANQYVMYTPDPTLRDLRHMFAGIDADIILYGHDHKPSIQHDDRQWFINCGSLGCPAQEHDIARAGLLSLSESSVSFAPLQIRYDADQVISLIRSLRYPDHENILKYFYGIQ